MMKTTPIIGRGPVHYALIEPAPAELPRSPSSNVLERPWHLQQLAAIFASVPPVPPFHPGLGAQRALTERGLAHVEDLAAQLAGGLTYDAFYELLAIDPQRALAVLDAHEALPAALALLRRHREPGQLAQVLRGLELLGDARVELPRAATSTELLIAHGRAVSVWLRRELPDQALLARALSELAYAAGIRDVYFEESADGPGTDTYRVLAYARSQRFELVYQHDTKSVEPVVISGFLNEIARRLEIDVVVVAISELGTVFTWGTRATIVRAAQAGVFGWNAEAEWEPYVTFRLAGELTADALARAARILGMEEVALVAALEGAACAGARLHPAVPREIELTAEYEAARSAIVLRAIAVVADPVMERDHISLAVARSIQASAVVGDELPLEMSDAAERWFSFTHEPVGEAAEDAVNLWLADRYLPREITDAAR